MTDDERALIRKDMVELLGALEQRFDAKLDSLESRIREYVHDTETNLLTAFHKFQTMNDSRMRNLETFQSTSTLRLAELEAAGRLSALELKVAEIEKKLDRRQ